MTTLIQGFYVILQSINMINHVKVLQQDNWDKILIFDQCRLTSRVVYQIIIEE